VEEGASWVKLTRESAPSREESTIPSRLSKLVSRKMSSPGSFAGTGGACFLLVLRNLPRGMGGDGGGLGIDPDGITRFPGTGGTGWVGTRMIQVSYSGLMV
jgi:hypothetical protein